MTNIKRYLVVIAFMLLSITLYGCNEKYVISFDSVGGSEVASIGTNGKSIVKKFLQIPKKKDLFLMVGLWIMIVSMNLLRQTPLKISL
ncbi:MAG: hypothetical protein PHC62_08240 [Candidatus Izemoplasmatales bacterium]|jgi:hypothetical protein|nr:hypothetical protein [Candidatus Izemoplasmatales bacterium]